VSRAKTAELIKTQFGLWTRVGPRKHVQVSHAKGRFRDGKVAAHFIVRGISAVSCAKMAEPIEIPFEL